MADNQHDNPDQVPTIERLYYSLDKKVALMESSQQRQAEDFSKQAQAVTKIANNMTKIVTRQEFKESQEAQDKVTRENAALFKKELQDIVEKRIVPLETGLKQQISDTGFLVKLKTAIGEKAFNVLVTAIYGLIAISIYFIISGKSFADFIPGGTL